MKRVLTGSELLKLIENTGTAKFGVIKSPKDWMEPFLTAYNDPYSFIIQFFNVLVITWNPRNNEAKQRCRKELVDKLKYMERNEPGEEAVRESIVSGCFSDLTAYIAVMLLIENQYLLKSFLECSIWNDKEESTPLGKLARAFYPKKASEEDPVEIKEIEGKLGKEINSFLVKLVKIIRDNIKLCVKSLNKHGMVLYQTWKKLIKIDSTGMSTCLVFKCGLRLLRKVTVVVKACSRLSRDVLLFLTSLLPQNIAAICSIR